MIKRGDVVYFKSCTREPSRRSQAIAFKGGSGFGVMLGIVPPGHPAPQEQSLFLLMGQAGYVAFDVVADLLGNDIARDLIAKFEAKYYPKVEPGPVALVDSTGKALETSGRGI